jgi:hypothetical protein
VIGAVAVAGVRIAGLANQPETERAAAIKYKISHELEKLMNEEKVSKAERAGDENDENSKAKLVRINSSK